MHSWPKLNGDKDMQMDGNTQEQTLEQTDRLKHRQGSGGREGAFSHQLTSWTNTVKYLLGCHENAHSSSPSILTFGFPCLENFASLNEGIGFKCDHRWRYFFFFLQSAAGVWMNVVICKKWWVVERWAFWPLGSELKLNCISKFKLLQLQLFGHVRISSCVIFFNPCIENNKALAKPEGVRCGLWATSAITQWRVRIILVGI